MMANLSLSAEEDDDLLLVPPEQDNRILSPQLWLVGRFLTNRLVNFGAMKNRMADIWQPVKGITIKEIDGQRYLFQLYHVMDMERIMDGGPWSFDNHLLLLQRVNSGEVPTQVPLNLVSFWVQIYDLPVGYMSESIGQQLGNSVGQFLSYDSTNNSSFWRSYMRIRVAIDVRKPLLRRKKISKPDGVGFVVNFKYERLASFCFVCGLLGHTERFCEVLFSSNDKDLKREWGVWLRAPDKRNQQTNTSKWLRDFSEVDTHAFVLKDGENSGRPSAPLSTRSETQLIPINFGNSGTNLGRTPIQSNNMHDTRDSPAGYHIQNTPVDEGGEGTGLLITEDRKRRRANKQPEAQLGLMEVEQDNYLSPPTNSSDIHSSNNPHTSKHTLITSTAHSLTVEPGYQAHRQL
ncbi:uncharacterized protein [Primulina eburnea]|uniref:uncharacterized protein n=1 Tax=Primulina eburnea TaxID=1245227 RepID=UPI003C6C22A6